MQLRVPREGADRLWRLGRLVALEPFQRRSWAELGYYVAGSALAIPAAALLAVMALTGVATTVVLVGIAVLALTLRTARLLGRWQRALARVTLQEEIAEPPARTGGKGILGWLKAAFSDRAAWGSMGYFAAKVPLTIFGSWAALGLWAEGVLALASGVTGGTAGDRFGLAGRLAGNDYGGGSPLGRLGYHVGLFLTGVVLVLIAPWTMRAIVTADRWLMHVLLGPGVSASRVRTLEESRSRTLDAATARLRRIERDLHDGTQAQLVALAMRLGQAKEELDHLGPAATTDLDYVRRLVDEAHRGAKEAITDLRDLARGIHPPALDTGLENALVTLAARSSVPATVQVDMAARPSPAVEAIAYFCAAELLANVAQHSGATRASLTCAQHGPWLRVVVRDDGRGGAAIGAGRPAAPGGSGLAGLAERVAAVDGHLSIASPPGGPTTITVDLPWRA